jgi:hypothetical protein
LSSEKDKKTEDKWKAKPHDPNNNIPRSVSTPFVLIGLLMMLYIVYTDEKCISI